MSLLDRVGLSDPHSQIDDYPHQLSGGMRQRVMIAMALSCNPRLLIADEPTTALDVTVEAQILDLMRDLQQEYEMSIMLITHNLGVVAEMCDRVMVMYLGKVIEEGSTVDTFYHPRHPYTHGLLESIPQIGLSARLTPIEGSCADDARHSKGLLPLRRAVLISWLSVKTNRRCSSRRILSGRSAGFIRMRRQQQHVE